MFRRIGSISIEKSGQARGLVECSEEGGVVLESVTARGGGQSENFRINNGEGGGGVDSANVREEVLQIEYNSKERRYEKSLGKSVDGGKGGREKRKMGFAFCGFVFGRRGVSGALISRQKYLTN